MLFFTLKIFDLLLKKERFFSNLKGRPSFFSVVLNVLLTKNSPAQPSLCLRYPAGGPPALRAAVTGSLRNTLLLLRRTFGPFPILRLGREPLASLSTLKRVVRLLYQSFSVRFHQWCILILMLSEKLADGCASLVVVHGVLRWTRKIPTGTPIFRGRKNWGTPTVGGWLPDDCFFLVAPLPICHSLRVTCPVFDRPALRVASPITCLWSSFDA